MTDAEADAMQQWAGMDGAIAFHLIERHAGDWNDAGQMMNAWLRANTSELEKDAARYRWLRGPSLIYAATLLGLCDEAFDAAVDAAIDSAMKG